MANAIICSIPECGKPICSRGWCSTHYQRWRKYGTPKGGGPLRVKHSGACKVDGCAESALRKDHGRGGYCSSHYQRWRKHGDPVGGKSGRGEAYAYAISIAGTNHGDECVYWAYQRDSKGYGRVRIIERGKTVFAHRLICELVYGKPPTNKHQAAHTCGKGHLGCCNPRHLRWATALSNQRDRIRHGTSNHGSRSAKAKLTEDQVREIRSLLGARSQQDIADIYGVSQVAISLIKRGRTWSVPPRQREDDSYHLDAKTS